MIDNSILINTMSIVSNIVYLYTTYNSESKSKSVYHNISSYILLYFYDV